MSAENESSIMSGTGRENISLAVVRAERSICRSLFRPWAFVFIGLSLSVTLWGFGYKLSRYNPHSDASSRALLAKLWDKHQDVSQITAAAEASAQPAQSQLVLPAVLLLLCQRPDPGQCLFLDPDESRQIHVPFQPVVPLRSPPSSNIAA